MSKLSSKIRLQTAIMLARDIQRFRAGDASRFARMVDGKGKQVLTPIEAQRTIEAICQEACEFWPATTWGLRTWLSLTVSPIL